MPAQTERNRENKKRKETFRLLKFYSSTGRKQDDKTTQPPIHATFVGEEGWLGSWNEEHRGRTKSHGEVFPGSEI